MMNNMPKNQRKHKMVDIVSCLHPVTIGSERNITINVNSNKLKKDLKENPNRSDFKIYTAPDDGHGTLGDHREHFSIKRIEKGKKWKPK